MSGCFLLSGVVATSSSGARTTFAVDHQVCYTAASSEFLRVPTPALVKLINQFSPNGFAPKIGAKLAEHCNPTHKFVIRGKTIVGTNWPAHLGCFSITASQQPTFKVSVTNEFGTASLDTGQPNLLCLPTWMGFLAVNGNPATPPGLNHFTCYPVSLVHGGYNPPPVSLQDEFTRKGSASGSTFTLVKVQVSPVPQELCLPTEKIVGKKTFPIIDPNTHLLCFPVTQTPIPPYLRHVWDENQFGTSRVTINKTKSLCVPSTKQVLGPAG